MYYYYCIFIYLEKLPDARGTTWWSRERRHEETTKVSVKKSLGILCRAL